jgi:hypothetical protein
MGKDNNFLFNDAEKRMNTAIAFNKIECANKYE